MATVVTVELWQLFLAFQYFNAVIDNNKKYYFTTSVSSNGIEEISDISIGSDNHLRYQSKFLGQTYCDF